MGRDMMKKALKKSPGFSGPRRRVVKRGAPPIIKPRRLPGRPQAAPAKLPQPAPELELESAVAEAGDLGEAAPEEVAAELISVAGEAGDEVELRPEAFRRAPAEPANFLAIYFKEMAELDVLRPEEEFRQARAIEQIELDIWDRLLTYPPLLDYTLKVIELTLENSLTEFRTLRRACFEHKKAPSKAHLEKYNKTARKISEKLRVLDIDKRILDAVLREVAHVAREGSGRMVEGRWAVAHRSASFRRFYGEVAELQGKVQRAKNEFVKANLRLVVSIARRFNHGRMPLADLIQEGNIGLIKAVERFDYRRGYRFSTYASWWIRHAISRALADKGRAVRLPVHMIDAYHRVAKSRRELQTKLGRAPTSDELGTATGIAAAKIEKMRSYLLDQSFSLDRPVSDEDGRRFVDFIQDPNAEETSPVDTLAEQAMTEEVRSLLHGLKPIEAEILRQRFGLDDDRELTLKEIGEKYNLSRERIRQLQEQALMKMRRALQRKDLM